MKKYPDWVYNYRIKTIQEFKKEYHQYDDLYEELWREKVPRAFVRAMDVLAGKPIKDLIIDTIFFENLKESKDNAIFDVVIPGKHDTFEISKAMITPLLSKKINTILKI